LTDDPEPRETAANGEYGPVHRDVGDDHGAAEHDAGAPSKDDQRSGDGIQDRERHPEQPDAGREATVDVQSAENQIPPVLSSDELAFYDAVATNESAIAIQGEDVLAEIARELVAVMRRDVRTDWTVRDDVRAKLRASIKRLLVKYKYPPDKQPEAIKLVMDQMQAMAPRYADEPRFHIESAHSAPCEALSEQNAHSRQVTRRATSPAPCRRSG